MCVPNLGLVEKKGQGILFRATTKHKQNCSKLWGGGILTAADSRLHEALQLLKTSALGETPKVTCHHLSVVLLISLLSTACPALMCREGTLSAASISLIVIA